METISVIVDEMINSDIIAFGDSEGMIQQRLDDGLLTEDEYEILMGSMDTPETKQLILDWKFDECSADFIESIATEGIVNPVAVLDDTVLNGHHRLAVAQKIGIPVPVNVYEYWLEFEKYHKWNPGSTMDHWEAKKEVAA